MGGHGGLNILPQKKWNVYNFENREKVRKDEEAAAKEEQLKREQSRRRDAEFRIERLRQARGLHISSSSSSSVPSSSSSSLNAPATEQDSRHFNLFDGLNGFSSLAGIEESDPGEKKKGRDVVSKSFKKRRIEDAPVKPPPEDEKYKLGYGLIGKGVEAPWYASKPSCLASDDFVDSAGGKRSLEVCSNGAEKKCGGRKTIEQLREERMKREKHEKERERSLLCSLGKKREDRHFSRQI